MERRLRLLHEPGPVQGEHGCEQRRAIVGESLRQEIEARERAADLDAVAFHGAKRLEWDLARLAPRAELVRREIVGEAFVEPRRERRAEASPIEHVPELVAQNGGQARAAIGAAVTGVEHDQPGDNRKRKGEENAAQPDSDFCAVHRGMIQKPTMKV